MTGKSRRPDISCRIDSRSAGLAFRPSGRRADIAALVIDEERDEFDLYVRVTFRFSLRDKAASRETDVKRIAPDIRCRRQ